MTRFVFTGLAALGVLAAIAFWWRPQSLEIPHLELVPSVPSELDAGELDAGEPALAEPVAAKAVEAAPATEPVPAVTASPAVHVPQSAAPQVAVESEVPSLGEPVLPEGDVLEVIERPDFEDGPPGELVSEEPGSEEAEVTSGEPPAPVDVQQSGELIRRMLVLYDAIRE